MLMSCPVVIPPAVPFPPTISLAPLQDRSSMQVYTEICIRGMLKATVRSAFLKSR